MPQAVFEISHPMLQVEVVKKRVHEAIILAAFQGEFESISDIWPQERLGQIKLKYRGNEYEANLTVLDGSLRVEITLSWMSWMFRSQIEKEIRGRLERVLSVQLSKPVIGDD